MWSASARCRRGPPLQFVNFTPTTAPRGAAFAREERFRLGRIRVHVQFGGTFTTGGVAGRVRVRARIRGRRATRCDSGSRTWSALPPGKVPSTGPGAPDPVTTVPPGEQDPYYGTPVQQTFDDWSMEWRGGGANYITNGGGDVALAPPAALSGSVLRGYLYLTAEDGTNGYRIELQGPDRGAFEPGRTYPTTWYYPEPGAAAVTLYGNPNNCDLRGTLTINALAFADDGSLRTADIAWQGECDANIEDPTLNGSLVIRH
jgi:hypothetical protein